MKSFTINFSFTIPKTGIVKNYTHINASFPFENSRLNTADSFERKIQYRVFEIVNGLKYTPPMKECEPIDKNVNFKIKFF